ncbi:MAG: hypothetical protein WBM78_12900, partial [Desulfobacterales bacterium]
FPAAAYIKYASPQTLVRPCPAKKILIYELDTQQCLKRSRMGTNYRFLANTVWTTQAAVEAIKQGANEIVTGA